MKTILLIMVISFSYAQTLSIDEAVRVALENKAAITSAQKDVDIARLNSYSSASLLLPSINASNSFRETTYGNSFVSGGETYSGGFFAKTPLRELRCETDYGGAQDLRGKVARTKYAIWS